MCVCRISLSPNHCRRRRCVCVYVCAPLALPLHPREREKREEERKKRENESRTSEPVSSKRLLLLFPSDSLFLARLLSTCLLAYVCVACTHTYSLTRPPERIKMRKTRGNERQKRRARDRLAKQKSAPDIPSPSLSLAQSSSLFPSARICISCKRIRERENLPLLLQERDEGNRTDR